MSERKQLVIGTRGSELALWQANYTKTILENNGYKVTLNIIKTKGDRITDVSFEKIEGKGFFTKEIEEALLNKECDLAVHSCKDLPTENPDGLMIAAYSKRANPFDILLIRKERTDFLRPLSLCEGAKVGTSSSRRKAQIQSLRTDITLADIRGNVPTRIDKLRKGDFDAIILAAAGIERLELDVSDLNSVLLCPPIFIPAPAQGILAYQIRTNDMAALEACQLLKDDATTVHAQIERDLLTAFQGGCQIPLGVYCNRDYTHIIKAEAWNKWPLRLTVPTKIVHNQGNELVSFFNHHTKPDVFISRSLENEDYLVQSMRSNGYKLTGKDFIRFNALDFEINISKEDILFFSSKKGFKYFVEGFPHLSQNHCKIAAMGSGTAQYIRDNGFYVDFTADSTKLEASVLAWISTQPNAHIHIIRGTHTAGTLQSILPQEFTETIVYENNPEEAIELRQESILVFTSPQNATAYFEKHQLMEHQDCVCIGSSTSKKLKELHIQHEMAIEPSVHSLTDAIFYVSFRKNFPLN